MRRKLFTLFTAAVGVASIATLAKAATVNYWIVTTADPKASLSGTWQVYGQDSTADNDGLAQTEFDVVASGPGVSMLSGYTQKITHPADGSSQYQGAGFMGFGSSFNSSGTLTSGLDGSRTGIILGQSTIYSGSDNPSIDMGIFVGVGQENATASPQNGSQGPIDGSGTPTGLANNLWTYIPNTTLFSGVGDGSWSQTQAGTLLAQGTYSVAAGSGGFLTVVPDAAEVLGTGETIPPGGASFPGTYPAGSNQLWGYDPYQLGYTPFVTNNGGNGVGDSIKIGNVPEPASIGLLVLGMGMIGGGRKIRRKTA